MGTHPDVLIVGGGVIGLTTAYYLAREGVSVRLLDRSAPGTEASWAGAGIVPPGNPQRAVSATTACGPLALRRSPRCRRRFTSEPASTTAFAGAEGLKSSNRAPTPRRVFGKPKGSNSSP